MNSGDNNKKNGLLGAVTQRFSPSVRKHGIILSALSPLFLMLYFWNGSAATASVTAETTLPADAQMATDIAQYQEPAALDSSALILSDSYRSVVPDTEADEPAFAIDLFAVHEFQQSTLDAAEPEESVVWHEYSVKSGDTLSAIFSNLGWGIAEMNRLLAAGKETRSLTRLRPGDVLYYQEDEHGQLAVLKQSLSRLDSLLLEKSEAGWSVNKDSIVPVARSVAKNGRVNGPLSISLRNAGIPAGLANEFVSIFSGKVNFSRDMRAGATFKIVYQELIHEGKLMGTGSIQAAELVNAGEVIRVYRHETGDGIENYYMADGSSLQPSILRTPVKYTRISSRFTTSRRHPVLGIVRAHKGVDLAAPTGTPVKAAADGRVSFVGWSGGYGRMIELKNMGAYSTRYGHLSRFVPTLKKGDRVRQGQIIGYVGQSGVATGPHLHYEIYVNRVAYDPLKVALPDSSPLPKKYMADFKTSIQPLVAVLDSKRDGEMQQMLAAYDGQLLKTASVAAASLPRL